MAEVKKWHPNKKCEIRIIDTLDLKDIGKQEKCRRCGQPHFMIIPRVIPVKLESDSKNTRIQNKIPTLLESVNKLTGGIN